MSTQRSKNQVSTTVTLVYAFIGTSENRDSHEVAHNEKTRILLRLDDMGIAPK
jgi:hypothetical protein